MASALEPVEVFCSYSHKDESLLGELKAHLAGLQRQGRISTWHDRQIQAGTNWAEAIDTHLETASLILLLVSSDFIASNYCYQIEMQRAMQRHKAHTAQVIPIIVRPCDWTHTPFAQLQCLPLDGKPVTEWANRDSAWQDVAAGIRRAIEDLPLLAQSTTHAELPAIWNIPYPRNPFFIGRNDLLSRLHTQLQAGQVTAISQPQAISGLGGIGKTQTAVEYAYRYHQEYEVVLWTRAENQETLIASYNTIATLLNLPERETQKQDITIQAVKRWLQTYRKWLLILDNADDLNLLPEYLPPVLGGHLLLTTRAWDMQRLAQRIEVETLPLEQATMFLLRRASLIAPDADLSQARIEDRQAAMQIAQELGGLPLALDQAGAYLEATGMSLSQYLQVYQRHRRTLLQERRALVHDHPEPVATTWSLSFQRVEEKNKAAANLLRLCAFLAPDTIPENIITQGAPHLGPSLSSVAADPLLLNQAIEALRAYSLIQRDPRTQTLSVHRLVQAVLRDSMTTKAEKEWKQRVVRAVHASCPNVEDVAQWDACELWVPHAQVCAIWIEQDDMALAEAADLLNEAGVYLDDRWRYGEAERLYVHALSIHERHLGVEHPDTATSLNNLAALYRRQGKYVLAEPLYLQALQIWERQSGAEHPYTAICLNNLALLYDNQGKFAQAEPLYLRALQIRKQKLGADHPYTATCLNNLALLYHNQGKFVQAEPLYLRALQIREQKLGADHPDTANSLNNLAGLYNDQSKYAQAEPLFLRALQIREQKLGVDHPYTAISLGTLAQLYMHQNKYTEAESLLQRASTIFELQLGTLHPHKATCLNELARVYESQGKFAKAEPLFLRALTIYKQQLGPQHPDTKTAQKNYASLLRAMGRDEEAASLETYEMLSS